MLRVVRWSSSAPTCASSDAIARLIARADGGDDDPASGAGLKGLVLTIKKANDGSADSAKTGDADA